MNINTDRTNVDSSRDSESTCANGGIDTAKDMYRNNESHIVGEACGEHEVHDDVEQQSIYSENTHYAQDSQPNFVSANPACVQELQNKPEKKISFLRMIVELAIALVVAFSVVWFLKTYVVQPFEVPSSSMAPTLSVGDKFLADMVFYKAGGVQKGDVVCFEDKTQEGRILVKRVIATAGQVIDIKNGHVTVDGVILYEPYVHGKPTEELPTTLNNVPIKFPYTVPENSVWVMGDNRTGSQDSRFFGSIEESSIIGKALIVYWPFENIAIL